MMVNAWRTGQKLAWDVPRGFLTYMVQEVLAPDFVSLRAYLLSREVGFFCSLLTSPSHKVTVLALLAERDVSTNLGSKLALVRELTKRDPCVEPRAKLAPALVAADTRDVPE